MRYSAQAPGIAYIRLKNRGAATRSLLCFSFCASGYAGSVTLYWLRSGK